MPATCTVTWRRWTRGLAGALLATLVSVSPTAAQSAAVVPGELLVGFREGVTSTAAEAIYGGLGATRVEELSKIRVHRIRVSPEAMDRVRAALQAHAEVTFVERNAVIGPQDTPGTVPVADEILVGFQAGHGSVADGTVAGAGGTTLEQVRGTTVRRVRVPAGLVDTLQQRLSNLPGVAFVEPQQRQSSAMVPSDPSFTTQWHLPRIAAPSAWDLSPGAPTITIAILDSGVDGTHPDLAAKMVPGYNFYSNNTNTADAFGHGTQVAGVAAAIGNNSVGVAGVAWQAKLMPVRVSDSTGYALSSAIANGLTWAVDHGARVMNLSFNGIAGSLTIRAAAQYVQSKGGLVVAAAGNCGCTDSTADNPYIISVSATDQNDALATFSSHGPYVDVAAPGVAIMTTTRGGGYNAPQGTSFSTPIVTGVIALMMGGNPSLSPQQIETLLKANADDLGAAGRDGSFGYGRVNAFRAVAAAMGSSTTPPPPDTVAPADVQGFLAQDLATGSQVALSWNNPTSADFAGTLVLRRKGSPVTDVPAVGASYATGQTVGASTVVYVGPNRSLTDGGLTLGQTYYYRAFTYDAPHNYSGGVSSSASVTQAVVAPTMCPAEIVVDNLAAGVTGAQVSYTGTWTSSTASSFFGLNKSLLSKSNRNNSYTWKTGVLSSGSSCTYQVFLWWASGGDRSPSAPYVVSGHTGTPATIYVDQRTGGGQWQLHGTYTFAAGASATVRVSDPYGPVSADSIRLVRTTTSSSASSSLGAPILVDNGAAGTSYTGKWCTSSAPNPLGAGSIYSCGGSTDSYRWTPTVPATGRYEVFVWWTANLNRSAAVPAVVSHATGAANTSLNQQQNGGLWNSLGTFSFPQGATGFVQFGKNGAQTSADAVLLVPRP